MSASPAKKSESKVIGLTGGIASGKSTAAAYLASKGIPVIDSDTIVSDLWIHDQAMLEEIREVFAAKGDEDLKRVVRNRIFHDKEMRDRLNDIIHPKVFSAIETRLRILWDEPLVVVDVPLLFETGYDHEVDLILLIDLDEETQIKRLMARDGISKEIAKEMIKTQMPMVEKRLLADVVITNDKSIHALYDALDVFIKEVSE